jgi:hypothetical protein
MLRKTSDLFDFKLHTQDDEEMGKVHDFYFDRDDWTVRYLVADIGSWLFGREVLISTSALGSPNWNEELLEVDLTKEQVKDSPDIDLAVPVSRTHEEELTRYYGWPTYWGVPMYVAGGVAPAVAPVPAPRTDMPREVVEAVQNSEESHIISVRDTTDYSIEASDDGIGHIDDFFVDDQDWTIRYLLVDTGNWLPGKKVLISPRWVESVDWNEGRVFVNMTKEQIKDSPEYDPYNAIPRSYEAELHRHYGYPQYW